MSDHSASDCQSVDPLVTPYVDGELGDADRARLDAHLGRCAPCRARLGAEQSVRAVLRAEHASLCQDRAPLALVARCRADARAPAAPLAGPISAQGGVFAAVRRRRLAPLAAAATLLLAAGIGIIYQATGSSVQLLAAELTADPLGLMPLVGKRLGGGVAIDATSGLFKSPDGRALLLYLRDTTNVIPHAYFGWTEGNPIAYLLKFLVFGEGDTAPVTREVLRQTVDDPQRRPRIHVG